MQRIIQYYRLFNILSLDVAFGSVVSAMFLSNVFETEVKFQGFLCLGLTVWLIYSADHLVDAKSIVNDASTSRHRFHQDHFKPILFVSIGVFMFIILLLFFIYRAVFVWGACLAVLVMIYFLLQRRLGFLKELLGAILYCTGVMLPAIALSGQSVGVLFTLPAILFFNTALLNLILFSWFDYEKDLAHKHGSLVTTFGGSAAKGSLGILFFIQFALLITSYQGGVPIPTLAVFAGMDLVLLLIYISPGWFSIGDRYRLAGDAVFLIPIFNVF